MLSGKESACAKETIGDVGSILGWERSLEEGTKTHAYFSLENPMERGDWQATVP